MGYNLDVDLRDRDILQFGASYWYERPDGQMERLHPAGVHIYRGKDLVGQGVKDTVPQPVVRPSHVKAWVKDMTSYWFLFVTLALSVALTFAYPHDTSLPFISAGILLASRGIVAGAFELHYWAREK